MIKNTMANKIILIVKYILLSVLINSAICNACSTTSTSVPQNFECKHLRQDFHKIKGIWKFASSRIGVGRRAMTLQLGKLNILFTNQNGFRGEFYYNTDYDEFVNFSFNGEFNTYVLIYIKTWEDKPIEAEIFICNNGQEFRITSYDKKYDWIFSRRAFFSNNILNNYMKVDTSSRNVFVYDKSVALNYLSPDKIFIS